jgi:type I restriction enzyme S subunit
LSSGIRNNLNSDIIKEFPIFLPKISFQKNISEYLFFFDKKIELNNAINSELEKLAKTLYNYWFVQFDFPNAKGKPYRASGGKMEYSEVMKREIPKGWEVISLGELLYENKQSISDNFDKNKMLGLDLSIMPTNSMCLNECGKANDFDSNRFLLKKYDLLFGSIRPYLKKAGFSAFDGVVNGTVLNFRCKEDFNFSFSLCTITNELLFKYAITRSSGNGTRMPIINANELLEYSIAYDKQTSIQFENYLSTYWKMIVNNINQNFELIKLRDFLLPLLMNGQVRVGDV